MNGIRFDSLTKHMTAGSSRRVILGALAGILVGLGGGWSPGDAEAKSRRKRKRTKSE